MTASSTGDDLDPKDVGADASTPEEARANAEQALSEIEDLADLDDDAEEASGGTTTSPSTPEEDPAPQASEAATAPSGETPPSSDSCRNCGASLRGPYCGQCGQTATDPIRPLWRVGRAALMTSVGHVRRFLRTLFALVVWPGDLTTVYVQGRRTHYVRPLRLCLLAAAFLFGVLLVTAPDGLRSPDASVPSSSPNTLVRSLNLDAYLPGDAVGSPRQRHRLTQVLRSPVLLLGSSTLAALLLLPGAALVLKLCYARSGRYYAEHVIFTLHLYTLAFLAAATSRLILQQGAGWPRIAALVVAALPVLGLVIALYRVYDQGVLSALLTAVWFLLIFFAILALGTVVLVAGSVHVL